MLEVKGSLFFKNMEVYSGIERPRNREKVGELYISFILLLDMELIA